MSSGAINMAAGGHINYLETPKGDNRSPPLKTFLRPLSTRINNEKNLNNQLLVLRASTLTIFTQKHFYANTCTCIYEP